MTEVVSKGKSKGLPADKKPVSGGVIPSPDLFRAKAAGKRFILTAAQNNTKVHKGFWQALQKFAKKTKSQIMVSKISYNKNGWQKITADQATLTDGEPMWYDPAVVPFIVNESTQLAHGLVFSAELDILPTAVSPLTGLDNYTGNNSMIVPHTKMQLHSYARMKGYDPRFGMTTGVVTLRNYIERRAGQLASYHHVYGAMYVEIDESGDWFARQIVAADDGSFFDLDRFVHPEHGCVSAFGKHAYAAGGRERVLNLGDIHAEKLDEFAFRGAKDMMRVLRPTHIAVHDLLDFESRNHHNVKDPFFRARMNGITVEDDFRDAAMTLEEIGRETNANLLLVRSNHDMAFDRWLKEFDGTRDPDNAAFFHYHMWRRFSDPTFDNYEHALTSAAQKLMIDTSKWVHIKEDDSYVIHGIELGVHGHLGPNGARGNPKSYRQLGRKLNTGHTHSASIIDGVWTAGVLASLDMGYNKGPSSWSHASILTHQNGKRQMIVQRGSKWRA